MEHPAYYKYVGVIICAFIFVVSGVFVFDFSDELKFFILGMGFSTAFIAQFKVWNLKDKSKIFSLKKEKT